jgi:hypothetical protein
MVDTITTGCFVSANWRKGGKGATTLYHVSEHQAFLFVHLSTKTWER